MKLVETARAPNPRRVRIFLAEKGIEVPTEQIDLGEMEHRRPEFAKLNPFRQVPVLVLDDGTVLSESMAICRYFEEIQPDPPLMGREPLEKAVIEMWQRRVELQFYLPVAYSFRHLHPAMAQFEEPQVPEWGEVNRARAERMLDFFDGELAGRRHVAGDSFSVADISLLVAVDFMKLAKIERRPELANLGRWYDEVSCRPSASA
ncbi:MAG: glutathione S-transferase [Alphaproteobacteria bacterium]|nr:MAG: glutathione S-transferase [Alphaproteobacteria bacterium]